MGAHFVIPLAVVGFPLVENFHDFGKSAWKTLDGPNAVLLRAQWFPAGDSRRVRHNGFWPQNYCFWIILQIKYRIFEEI